MNSRFARESGLTLVEMLVVLIIVGMVSTLLVQGLGNALALYSRVQANQQTRELESTAMRWWRSVISSTAPNRLDQNHFAGTDQLLSLRTYRPLLAEDGVMTEVTWRISESPPWRLIYAENSHAAIEFPISSQVRPSFTYLSKDGGWTSRWPVQPDSNVLPEAVRLGGAEYQLHAALRNHKDEIFFVDEIEFGRN